MTWTPPPPQIFKYDEKNKPEQYAAYTVQQLHDAHAAGLAEMATENEQLRKILVDTVAALGTGAGVSQNSSLEFLDGIPKEVRLTVDLLCGRPRLDDGAGLRLNDRRGDAMAGLRGMHYEAARELICRCMEQAGIEPEAPKEVQPLAWNVCHRVAQDAHKAGARDMNVLIARGFADAFVWVWKSLVRDVKQAKTELAAKGFNASFLDWIIQVGIDRAEAIEQAKPRKDPSE